LSLIRRTHSPDLCSLSAWCSEEGRCGGGNERLTPAMVVWWSQIWKVSGQRKRIAEREGEWGRRKVWLSLIISQSFLICHTKLICVLCCCVSSQKLGLFKFSSPPLPVTAKVQFISSFLCFPFSLCLIFV
jgi:hypothetical protein